VRVAGARARPPRPPPPPLSPVIAAHALDRGREAEGGRAVAAKPTLTFFFAARCAPTCSPSCASSPATCANPIAACRRKTWPRSGRGPGSSSTARRRSPSSTTCTPSSPRTMSPRGTWRIWRCGAPRWRGTCTCRRREFFFFLGGGGTKKKRKTKNRPLSLLPLRPTAMSTSTCRGARTWRKRFTRCNCPTAPPSRTPTRRPTCWGWRPKRRRRKRTPWSRCGKKEEGWGERGWRRAAARLRARARARASARLGPRPRPAPRLDGRNGAC